MAMASHGAPDRAKLINSLHVALEGLKKRRSEFDRYLTWVAKQLAKLPAFPAVTKHTTWSYDLDYIKTVIRFFGSRVDLLRQRGCNLDDTWSLNAGRVLDEAMESPKGLETTQSVLKRACANAEKELQAPLRQLHDFERTGVWDWINQLVVDVCECLLQEHHSGFLLWLSVRREHEALRSELDDELNREAVWLGGKRKRLEVLEKELEDHAGELQAAFAEHETMVLQLLEQAAGLEIRIDGRQTLITEYYRCQ